MESFGKPPQRKDASQSSAAEYAANKSVQSRMERVTEAAKDYLKHKSLKVKEYLGQLNPEDFDQLLEFDFQQQLKDSPPIEGSFSPEEELEKIKSLPKEQRRDSLAVFKENLARQREALATMRVFIERSIQFNHNVSREKLMGLVETFGTQYGFDEKQKQITEQVIEGYYENRQKVLDFRQQFTDDRRLVSELTGVEFANSEDISVSVGPMTIDIDADGFNSGRLYERADKPAIALKYGGFASQSIGEDPIYYVVINQDKWIRWVGYGDPSGKATRMHEYEHQKNKLFRAVFEHQKAPTELAGYIGEQDPETKKTMLEVFFEESRRVALERAKDEITACLLDRTLSQLQSQLRDLFFKQKMDPYDYLAYLRSWEEFKDDSLYQEAAQRMLVQEYRETIQKAVDSYAELVKVGRYSTQEATALLTDKAMDNWPKAVRRLLEQK